jgi:hypothetical protein
MKKITDGLMSLHRLSLPKRDRRLAQSRGESSIKRETRTRFLRFDSYDSRNRPLACWTSWRLRLAWPQFTLCISAEPFRPAAIAVDAAGSGMKRH